MDFETHSKPPIQPNPLLQATRTIRLQVISWVGIVGGAIALLHELDGVLTLADWATWITSHWYAWTEAFWQWVFSWVGVRIPKFCGPFLSFTAFGLAAAVGARVYGKLDEPSRTSIWTCLGTAAFLGVTFYVFFFDYVFSKSGVSIPEPIAWWQAPHYIHKYVVIPPTLILCGVLAWAFGILRFYVFMLFLTLFYFIIVTVQFASILEYVEPLYVHGYIGSWLRSPGQLYLTTSIIMFAFILICSVVSFLMLKIAPIDALLQRFTFIAVGLAILIGLSEISKYGPEIRALLKSGSH